MFTEKLHPSRRFLPTVFTERLPHVELLKDKTKDRDKVLTIIIGVICKDGILVQADTKFVDKDLEVSITGSKIFTMYLNGKPRFVVGFAGQKDVFKHSLEIITDHFQDFVQKNGEDITERQCEELLRQCRDLLYKNLNTIRWQRRMIKGSKELEVSLDCIFAGYVTVNTQPSPRLYNFSLNVDPDHQTYHIIGTGKPQMLFFMRTGEHALIRINQNWNGLSAKLVAQILSFPLKYIPEVNPTIGALQNSKWIKIDGVIEYGSESFFEKTFKAEKEGKKKDYIPELIETFINEISIEKVAENLKPTIKDVSTKKKLKILFDLIFR